MEKLTAPAPNLAGCLRRQIWHSVNYGADVVDKCYGLTMGCPPVNSPVKVAALTSYLFKLLPRIGFAPKALVESKVVIELTGRVNLGLPILAVSVDIGL